MTLDDVVAMLLAEAIGAQVGFGLFVRAEWLEAYRCGHETIRRAERAGWVYR